MLNFLAPECFKLSCNAHTVTGLMQMINVPFIMVHLCSPCAPALLDSELYTADPVTCVL